MGTGFVVLFCYWRIEAGPSPSLSSSNDHAQFHELQKYFLDNNAWNIQWNHDRRC